MTARCRHVLFNFDGRHGPGVRGFSRRPGAPRAAVRHLRNKKLRPSVLPESEITYGVRPNYLYALEDVATIFYMIHVQLIHRDTPIGR